MPLDIFSSSLLLKYVVEIKILASVHYSSVHYSLAKRELNGHEDLGIKKCRRETPCDIFQDFGWGTRTRTRKGRTRICSVTITPYPKQKGLRKRRFANTAAKVGLLFFRTNFSPSFFQNLSDFSLQRAFFAHFGAGKLAILGDFARGPWSVRGPRDTPPPGAG